MTGRALLSRGFGLFAAAVMLAGPASAQWRETIPVVRIGVLGGVNQAYASARAEPFRQYLADALGVDVQIVSAIDYPALVSAEINGAVQAAFLSATAFVAASTACDGCVEPLVIPTGPAGEAGYHAIMVARSGGSVGTVRDLPGRRLAVSAEDSIAGRLLPLNMFVAEGVATTDMMLVERASPAEAIAAMLAGEADAALAWSTLTGTAALGYDAGALAQMVGAGTLDMNEIAVVWASPLIPYGPLTVQVDLPQDLKDDLRAAMLGLRTEAPDALVIVDGGLGGGFIAADADAFAVLMTLFTDAAD